jgi:hypothetical protein
MKTAIIIMIPFLLIVKKTDSASAQPAGIKAGDKIRIDAPLLFDQRVTGYVAAISANDITFFNDDMYMLVPYSGIKNIRVSKGRKGNPGMGFLIGAGTGGILAGTYEAFNYTECVSTGWFGCGMAPRSRTGAFFSGFAGGAILGGVTGLFVGAFIKTERWSQPVSRFSAAATHQYSTRLHQAPVLTLKYSI